MVSSPGIFIYFSFLTFKMMDSVLISLLLSVAACGMAKLPAALNEWENQQKIFSNDHTKPAGLPSPNPTRSFWANPSPDANPLAREGSTGLLTTDTDVYIICSGIIGVAVAYDLSQTVETSLGPLKVVILDQFISRTSPTCRLH